jgi:integrase
VYHLRHSCASLLLAQGVHPLVVMEILGHSQINLTMNTYSHVTPTLQREAAGKMDARIAGDEREEREQGEDEGGREERRSNN